MRAFVVSMLITSPWQCESAVFTWRGRAPDSFQKTVAIEQYKRIGAGVFCALTMKKNGDLAGSVSLANYLAEQKRLMPGTNAEQIEDVIKEGFMEIKRMSSKKQSAVCAEIGRKASRISGKSYESAEDKLRRQLLSKTPIAANTEDSQRMDKLLTLIRCTSCGGDLRQTREGSLRAACLGCGVKYLFERAAR